MLHCTMIIMFLDKLNIKPFALITAKTLQSFGRSECKRVYLLTKYHNAESECHRGYFYDKVVPVLL